MSTSPTGAARSDHSATADPGSHEPRPPSSLADRLDEALLRLDLLRDRPGISATLAAVAVAVLGGGWWLTTLTATQPVEAGIPFVSVPGTAPPVSTVAEPAEPLVVHVAGAVRRPGIVILEPGARIVDAIDESGGALADAELDRINLAAPVVDGMQIRVPIPGEAVPINGVQASGGSGPAGPVDLNMASPGELETLRGIGPALAEAIVGWRTDHGPFGTLDDLLSVPGIGPAKLAGLADLVSL